MSTRETVNEDSARNEAEATAMSADGKAAAAAKGAPPAPTRGGAAHGITARGAKVSAQLICSIIAVAGICFVGILTETMMNVLFPHLMSEFNIDAGTVQWVTTACILVIAMLIPTSAFLHKRLSYLQIFSVSAVLAIVGGLIALWSPTFHVLLLARVIQGMSTGIAMPLMFNVILEQSPLSAVGTLTGLGNLVVGLAPAIGPVFGGLLINVMPWRHMFLVIIGMLVVFAIVGVFSLRQVTPLDKTATINVPQLAETALGMGLLIFGMQRAGSAVQAAVEGGAAAGDAIAAAVCLAVAAALIVAFARSALRSASPLLDVRVWAHPALRWAMIACIFIQFTQLSLSYIIPNFSQMGLGATTTIAGFVVLPGALLGALTTVVSGHILDRHGPRGVITFGLITFFAGTLYLALGTGNLTVAGVALGYAICEFGYSNTYSNMFSTALKTIPAESQADGNAMFNTMQQFGCALGTTVSATIMSICQASGASRGMTEAAASTLGAHVSALTMVAAVLLAAACIVFGILRRVK